MVTSGSSRTTGRTARRFTGTRRSRSSGRSSRSILVTSITIVSAIVLYAERPRRHEPAQDQRRSAQQFAWAFTYPNGKRFPSLRLPLDRQVVLSSRRSDVLHSFWVPRVRPEAGRRSGADQPARDHPDPARHLPGHLHRALRSRPFADAQRGDRDERRPTTTTGTRQAAAVERRRRRRRRCRRRRSFTTNGCGACHTFKRDPGANGKVGPDLDDLKAAAAKAPACRSSTFIKDSIVDPNKYIAPGLPARRDAAELRYHDPRRQARRSSCSICREHAIDRSRTRPHAHAARRARRPRHAAAARPARTAGRRPGWLRVLWVTPLVGSSWARRSSA